MARDLACLKTWMREQEQEQEQEQQDLAAAAAAAAAGAAAVLTRDPTEPERAWAVD